ncbi:hypothetical protein JD844_020889 [Phrynosoma platyrhinos]|uniref:Tetratricopeptide repeat domain 8 n=1 Tax=Phrynosoma platyrhinos TaxID=52577 RepID=A0ABQ7SSU9_PHRPL|nr:hypothetical protein JD844_020889 [Phrynosoma platyrhinos]
MALEMDPLVHALSYFRRRKFQPCSDLCSQMLEKEPGDQAAWCLKIRALTEMVYVDEIDVDQEGIAEMMLDENAIAQVARPGTSLKVPGTGQSGGPSQAVSREYHFVHDIFSSVDHFRPVTQAGRPLTGFVRPSTQGGRPGTIEQAIKTPRTAHTARPMTSASGRYVRLGTASMLTNPDGPFINISKLNLNNYAEKPKLAKALFEYIFHHENDVKNDNLPPGGRGGLGPAGSTGLDRLGLYREAETQFKSAFRQQDMVDTILYLAKVYSRLDQPLTALSVFKQGLDRFPGEVSLICGIARIHEEMNNISAAAECYKDVLKQDNTHVEAIACIGSNHFYSDQPEIALRFYRRLLQMGIYNSQLFNNLGLCCFYAQQYDLILSSFERALSLAESEEEAADVWYNLGHVAVGIGDINLAYQCFKLTLANNNDHAEAYNNLAVLEMQKGRIEQVGDLQRSYVAAQKSQEVFPEHVDTQQLIKQLKQHFARL